MKTKLIVTAALLAAAGFGCQRTYENRYDTADRRAQAEPIQQTQAPVAMEAEQPATGEPGQEMDINATQDLATDETSASFGGSSMAQTESTERVTDDVAAEQQYGIEEDTGMGGSGMGGSGKDAKMDHAGMDHAKMGHGADGGMAKPDAGTTKLIVK